MSEADQSQGSTQDKGSRDSSTVKLETEGDGTSRSDRLSAMAAAAASMTFIENAGKDKTVKIRVDDTRSAILMAASMVLLLTSCGMVSSNPDMRDAGVMMVILADLLCGASILWYCVLRFGFIRRIDPRFALICWHLVLGTGVLFSFVAMNVMLTLLTLSKAQP
ncbi:MAG: hypothetical protein K2W95_31255 [Candidatus Obscuribacterales bacterium]|nr:hypothetical protein [Candidatus Obscuribacterales bacterium]